MPSIVTLGGSFNPVHMGHVFAACYLAHLGEFDEVLVIPVFKHPFAKNLIEYHHRYEMCRLAMSWIPKVSISDIEMRLCNGSLVDSQPNYTSETVLALRKGHPDWEIYFAVGSDNAKEIKNWEGGEVLLQNAKPFVIGRAGHPDNDNLAILPEVCSTELREALRYGVGSPILRAFLPEPVRDYIYEYNLYNCRQHEGT